MFWVVFIILYYIEIRFIDRTIQIVNSNKTNFNSVNPSLTLIFIVMYYAKVYRGLVEFLYPWSKKNCEWMYHFYHIDKFKSWGEEKNITWMNELVVISH